MKCKNCNKTKFKIVSKWLEYSRLECFYCKFRFNVYIDSIAELKAYTHAIKSGLSADDFYYNINKELN